VFVAATSAQNAAKLLVTLMNEVADTTLAAWIDDARCTTGVTP
jgi:hypothetical protein